MFPRLETGSVCTAMPFARRKQKSQENETSYVMGKGGRYMKKEPPSPFVADYYSKNVVRNPTTIRRSNQINPSPKSTRSLSVPSLHATDTRAKLSPPVSPSRKPRSKSVRVNAAKKTLSFKRLKQLLGSHSELDSGVGLWVDETQAGTYRPLNIARPRSIGGSSDCSNSSFTHSDFSRCNSFRESSRSRISHGNDSVFGARQASYDSADYSTNHIPMGSADSNLRPYSIAYMPRSSSSTSLRNYGVQTKLGVDPRHHSIAAVPGSSIDIDGPYRKQRGMLHRTQAIVDDAESLWEDSQSFTYVNTPVFPSDPEYRQVAEELMSVSPTRKELNEFIIDPRRISDSVDPRRVSNDSGVESSSTKPNRSLPTTPVAQSFTSIRNGSPERPVTPHDYLSQDSGHSFPPGWDIAITPQGLRYFLDHTTKTTHWKLPNDLEDSLGLPRGWEVVQSSRYGTYYVNHNNKTAIYQHPHHARPPPPYTRPLHYLEEEETKDRRPPARSHSHRSTQAHRVLDPNASLPRRSKSFKDHETLDYQGAVSHERQLSTMTYVPPSPYQIAEIPSWLREYVEVPFGSKKDTELQWHLYSQQDLTGMDTMIKRLLKKGLEQIVRQYEYYRVAVQKEVDVRIRQRNRRMLEIQQQQVYPPYHTQSLQPRHDPYCHENNFKIPTNTAYTSINGPYPSFSEANMPRNTSINGPYPSFSEGNVPRNTSTNGPYPSFSEGNVPRNTSTNGPYPSFSEANVPRNTSINGPYPSFSEGNVPRNFSSNGPYPSFSGANLPRNTSSNGPYPSFSEVNVPRNTSSNYPGANMPTLQFKLSDSDFQGLEETFV